VPTTKIINLPHTKPPSRIVFTSRFDEVLVAISDIAEAGLARVADRIVDDARDTGSYQNRTGNTRRLITPNVKHALDDPTRYASTPVVVEDSDGVTRNKKQYTPPEGFDDVTIERRPDGPVVTVAAIVRNASPLEARGYDVLSHSVQKVVANADEVIARDFTDRRTKAERLSGTP
jgi:hypothetical protein